MFWTPKLGFLGNGKNQRDADFQRWHQKTCFLTPPSFNYLVFTITPFFQRLSLLLLKESLNKAFDRLRPNGN